VVARPTRDDSALLSLVDSAGREWKIAALPALPRRIFWVDSASADSATRHALARAFDEAALYSEDVRATAAHVRRRTRPARLRLATDSHVRDRVAPRRGRGLSSRQRISP